MSLSVFLAILGAALLHAVWNAIIRVGSSKATTMVIMTIVQGGMGVVLLIGRPLPEAHVWLWLLASGVFHAGYKVFLVFAYEHGDLSRVYPIARGAAPLGVLLIAILFLNEGLRGQEVFAIIILGFGILAMGRGAFLSGESRRLVPFALGSAAMTAGYSLVDGMGARAAGDAVQYVGWLFALDAVMFTPTLMALRGRDVLQANPTIWLHGSVAAACSFVAYQIVVWAMTVAPIPLVTALRETSILFAVLIGWLAFGERMDRTKALAAVLILVGIMLTRV